MGECLLKISQIVKQIEKQVFSRETGLKPQSKTLIQETVQDIHEELNKASIQWSRNLTKLEKMIEESAKRVARLE